MILFKAELIIRQSKRIGRPRKKIAICFGGDLSIPLEYYAKKIFRFIGTPKYMIKWNRLYCKVFYSLPSKTEKMLTELYISPF